MQGKEDEPERGRKASTIFPRGSRGDQDSDEKSSTGLLELPRTGGKRGHEVPTFGRATVEKELSRVRDKAMHEVIERVGSVGYAELRMIEGGGSN
ncbi:hypothetical protein R1flu_023162 [Riccia fluitans]|uniref:Uncharacterized protein n=1 Tax=Riccia fluitans TaxID=41844 RepID=A0ABD1XRR7_9MARC